VPLLRPGGAGEPEEQQRVYGDEDGAEAGRHGESYCSTHVFGRRAMLHVQDGVPMRGPGVDRGWGRRAAMAAAWRRMRKAGSTRAPHESAFYTRVHMTRWQARRP